MTKVGSGVRLDGQGKPLWLLLELTYRCPLKCPWCSNPLDFDQYRDELSTEEWKRVLCEGRKLGGLQLGFSGGEPTLRRDLEELVAEADGLGYYTNLITSGMGLSRQRLEALKEAGLKQIQLSLQHSQRDINDAMVGAKAHQKKLNIARDIKQVGFPVVLNVPVCRQNIEHTESLLAIAEELGVEYLEFANIQYYNWALLNRDELMPTAEQIEEAEAAVNAARERIGKRMTIYFVIPDYFDGQPKACMKGWGSVHLTIAPDGTALPCQQARVIKGIDYPSVQDASLEWIWKESAAFNKFRGDAWMKGPCRDCEEKETDYAGCRCQAYLLAGDAANTDPACRHSAQHHLVRRAVERAHSSDRVRQPLMMRQRGAANLNFMGGHP